MMQALRWKLSAGYYPLIMLDIWRHLDAESAAYFREKREEMLGAKLERLQEHREVGILSAQTLETARHN